MLEKTLARLPIKGVNSQGYANRIESKNRKGKALSDNAWEEVWIENLEKNGLTDVEGLKRTDETHPAKTESSAADDFLSARPDIAVAEIKFEEIILGIRKMADDPEKLFESHLEVFVDPAPPGRVINSRG
ncbi:MAG: hypothetical protein LBT31_05650 [Synergistaceae bacterium]|jgi:hypothetical protein|nr:hypothetical protein [Synergistaceae bacterium]